MKRHKPDFLILFIVLTLVAFGLLMIFSASMVWAVQVAGEPPTYYVDRQIIFALVGLVLMIILMNIGPNVLRKWAKFFSIITFAMLVAVLIPGIGHKAAGVRRWLGPIQPSELAQIGLLFYLAYIFDKNQAKLHQFSKGVFPPLLMLGTMFILVLLEPDMGTGMLLLLSGLIVIIVAGVRARHLFVIGALFTPLVALFAVVESYRSIRIQVFFHPWSQAYVNQGGYQVQQSLMAIYHGGLFGQGLGQGIAPYLYLPIPHEDFIFAVIVEELGLVGAFVLLALYASLVWRGIQVGLHLQNRFASLLAYGISGMIGVGTLINIAAVTGLIPVTGIPLPFISYGGTALVTKMAAMGILLSLSRYTQEERQVLRYTGPDNILPMPERVQRMKLATIKKKRRVKG